MAVRKTHNRKTDNRFFSTDMNETISKAKKHYKVFGEFYVNTVIIDNIVSYYAGNQKNSTTQTHFINTSNYGDRASWKEVVSE
ncbi:hypothetical protein [Paenibacillus sp. 1781tsa1]|uniref:hypothetical protein n=1 Tax=Paenibacillus sp. 1781tsa1 TaxID=2953810 RepID=UPI00209DC781|nr:hypothetical protein [Paenibacillus sp. 1781tsa1]MCP1185065.1 hypothetical protein [Paenibacillus sp. 1781tsa1]